jgi:hypothetical protein
MFIVINSAKNYMAAPPSTNRKKKEAKKHFSDYCGLPAKRKMTEKQEERAKYL